MLLVGPSELACAQGTLYGHSHCFKSSELHEAPWGFPSHVQGSPLPSPQSRTETLGKAGAGVTSLMALCPPFTGVRGCLLSSGQWGLS